MNYVFTILFMLSFIFSENGNNPQLQYDLHTEAEKTFTNPVLDYGPDPWVIRKDGYYFYMHTMYNNITIRKTKYMSGLATAETKVILSAPDSGRNSKNIWAPELHWLNGKWYMYYVAGPSATDFGKQRLFVLENSSGDPLKGTWIDRGELKVPGPDVFTIDPTILTYNNQHYILWSGIPDISNFEQRIYIAKLKNPYTTEGERVELSKPEYGWETVGHIKVNEGPEILKNGKGRIFLIYSGSFCGTDNYSLGLISLKENGNPMKTSDWVKSDKAAFQQKPSNNQYATGHNGFFKSPDGKEDWIIYHANSFPNQGCDRTRNPRMQRFTWNEDGTPNFGEPVQTGVPIAAPSGE